jgi:hypothetical protein
MERDQKTNQRMIDFATVCGLNWAKRVIYTTTTKIDSTSKSGVMILDEADTIIFEDLLAFYKNTNY